MITKIAYRLAQELEAKYGKNVDDVSLNQDGSAIRIKIKNQYECAVYTLLDDLMVEHIVQDVVETIQADFIYGRSTDKV